MSKSTKYGSQMYNHQKILHGLLRGVPDPLDPFKCVQTFYNACRGYVLQPFAHSTPNSRRDTVD